MKISMILVAGAQAFTCADRGLTCDLRDWVENNWWTLAVETFNFASNNREAYTHAIKSVSRAESPGKSGPECPADHLWTENHLIFKID